MQTILEVKNLTKRFGSPTSGFTAVDDISFSVEEGEIVGILGQNGAGKTTTISMLLGLLTPTLGSIKVFDKDLGKHREEILNKVNFSSAYINFPGRLTVEENLKIFAMLYDIASPSVRISEVMELFEITRYARTKYAYLSSGEQTRVHLAKAFLNKPKILFLDEPTAALDPDIADLVRRLLLTMQKKENLTVLLTSHNMAEVEELCDRVLFIDHGKIVAQDTPWGLAAKVKLTTVNLLIEDGMKRTLAYCQKQNFEAVSDGRYLTVKVNDQDIVYFLSFLAERGIKYQEISIDRPTLENFFLEATRT